jgi:hypothetical protein
MYNLIRWTEPLRLTEFYLEAERRGFENNANRKMLIDSLAKEQEWAVWILYYNNIAVGSVGAHSLPELGPNAYRICARTCVFTDMLPYKQLRGLKYTCQQHQNITAQFFIPQCIEWAGADKDLYITSHPSHIGTQRLVHNIYCPALVETGALERTCEMEYRGHTQTFWKLNVSVFLEQLNRLPRWEGN